MYDASISVIYYNCLFCSAVGMIFSMALTLITGPMKSGKSLELIARIAPYEFADKRVMYVQPKKNVRDDGISSRSGLKVNAVKVDSLSEITNGFDVIGVDEINMFDESDAKIIKAWINDGKEVFICGLDLDYRANLIPIVARVLELKPNTVILKNAVCDTCKHYDAQFTQILHNGEPVLGGLPTITPEDGTYAYEPRCRTCFVSS